MVTAIIVAAGKSERMGAGTDKAFLNLGSKPVVAWSLLAFERCADVDQIVLVVRKDQLIAAKAVALGEALTPEFRSYQAAVVENARVLAETLVARGLRIVSGRTESHVMLVDLRPLGITGKAAETLLNAAHITVNKNAIPFDPEKPFVTSGIRVGTPAVTTRGLVEADMKTIAGLMARAAKRFDTDADAIRAEVEALCAKYPLCD